MNVEDSVHNQAEASGITEKNGVTIIHYHSQDSDNDKFLPWYGKYKIIFIKNLNLRFYKFEMQS